MKYARKLPLLLIFAILPLSCTSRTAALVHDAPPPEAAKTIDEDSRFEPDDPFEKAYWNVWRNTPLVEKYFESDDADAEITVKGKCVFNETEYLVRYDLASAEKNEDGYFRITFSVENPHGLASESGSLKSIALKNGELFWKPVPDKTGLLLSFDDDYSPAWRQHFDLFDGFGAKVTFFVSGTASAENGLSDFCLEALRRGHCIGYHTLHHYDLTKVTREIFYRETIEAAQRFRNMGIPLNAFAYPYGFSRDWMREALAPHFEFTRGFGARLRLYDADTPASHTISKSIDNIQYPDDVQFERHIWLTFFSAKFIGGSIIPFATHDISDNAKWGIKPRRLAYVLQTAAEFKIRFYTYYDFSESNG